MFKNYLTPVLIFIFLLNNIQGQNTNVPDDNFEQALIDLGYDDVLDHYVLTSNINDVSSLNLLNKNIQDLAGIEDFASLTFLNVGNNQLTNLDIRQNLNLLTLYCFGNPLTSLDVTQNSTLELLYCAGMQLEDLDVSQNTVLKHLNCYDNQLTSLDVSHNPELQKLYFMQNQLTNIDVNQNSKLEFLYCQNNQLTSLDVSQNYRLTNLVCMQNPDLECIQVDNETDANAGMGSYSAWIKDATTTYSEACNTYVPDDNFEQALIDLGYDSGALDDYVPTSNIRSVETLVLHNRSSVETTIDLTGIENFSSLQELISYWYNFTSLDVSNNFSLKILKIFDGNILDSPLVLDDISLESLILSHATVTTLEISNNRNLSYLRFEHLGSTNLTISNNAILEDFSPSGIMDSRIVSMNVTNNPNLRYLSFNSSRLQTLNIVNNENLIGIYLDCDILSFAMNLTNNPNLWYIRGESIDFSTTLDLSDCPGLTYLFLWGGNLESLDVSANNLLTNMNLTGNPLNCIQVNQAQLDNIPAGWIIDPEDVYSLICD